MAAQWYGKTIVIEGSVSAQLITGYSSANAYQQHVWDLLYGIENYSQTGKALLLAINHPDLQVKRRLCHILPAPAPSQNPDQWDDMTPYKATKTKQLDKLPGDVEVFYNPRSWTGLAKKLGKDPAGQGPAHKPGVEGLNSGAKAFGIDPTGRGYGPRDVLFHELVHALLEMVGKFLAEDPDDDDEDQFGNREDFYAVLFTNIYLSEQGMPVDVDKRRLLRGSHKLKFESLEEVSPGLTDSKAFYMAHMSRIDDLFDVDDRVINGFAASVHDVDCDFNPLAARMISGGIVDDAFGGKVEFNVTTGKFQLKK